MGLAQTGQPMLFYYIPIHPIALTLSSKHKHFISLRKFLNVDTNCENYALIRSR